jgi:hypothetical protein
MLSEGLLALISLAAYMGLEPGKYNPATCRGFGEGVIPFSRKLLPIPAPSIYYRARYAPLPL